MKLLKTLFGLKDPKPQVAVVKTKECPRCKEVLNIELFGRNRTRKDGLQSWCTPCTYKQQKKNRFAALKKEKVVVQKAPVVRKVPVTLNPVVGEKSVVTITIQAVDRAKYAGLASLARKQNCKMNDIYQKMINDFLTLNA